MRLDACLDANSGPCRGHFLGPTAGALDLLCFYVLGAFLPSVPGRARNANPLIKIETPPEKCYQVCPMEA